MTRLPLLFVLLAGPALAASPAEGPLSLSSHVMAQVRQTAADGTHRITLAPAAHAAPGDAVVVQLAYRNTGPAPLADLVLANPLPAGLRYRGPVAGTPEPEVSADGRRFAPLAALTVALPAGGSRAATADDVTHVRWRLSRPLAPGASGTLGFNAGIR